MEIVRYVILTANQIACNGSETPWVYDPYGNLTSDANDLGSSTTYTYDTANRVSSITANSVTTTYAYNGDGDRIYLVTTLCVAIIPPRIYPTHTGIGAGRCVGTTETLKRMKPLKNSDAGA